MNACRRISLALLISLPLLSWAISPQTEREIDQLLDFIGNSSCEFERNGSTYTAAKARAHIELKYGNTRKYIESSEDFIKYAATKSSFTGRAYMIRCDGVTQATAQWLQQALIAIRKGPQPGAEKAPDNQARGQTKVEQVGP